MWSADLQTIRLLYALSLLLSVVLVVVGVQFSLPVVLGMFFIFGWFGVITTYHRFHSHHSFKFRWKWLEVLFTMCAMASGTGSAVGWAAIHRQHHSFADGDDDPHSPINKSVWELFSINYRYRNRKWRQVRDLLRVPYLVHFHYWYFLYLLGYVGAVTLIFGLWGVLNLFIAPSILIFIASGLTNFFNHGAGGYKPYPKSSGRNVWWLNFFNFGDGWHNNHHRHPARYTTKERWWEFDPAGSIIKLVKE